MTAVDYLIENSVVIWIFFQFIDYSNELCFKLSLYNETGNKKFLGINYVCLMRSPFFWEAACETSAFFIVEFVSLVFSFVVDFSA